MFHRIRYQVFKFAKRPQFAAGLETEKIKTDWQNIIAAVNKDAVNKSQALYVNKDNELVVRVEDHLWLQEMYFYRDFIEKELASKNKSIKTVRFVV